MLPQANSYLFQEKILIGLKRNLFQGIISFKKWRKRIKRKERKIKMSFSSDSFFEKGRLKSKKNHSKYRPRLEKKSDSKRHPKKHHEDTEYDDYPHSSEIREVHRNRPTKHHEVVKEPLEMPKEIEGFAQKELRIERLFTMPYNEQLTVGREIPNLQIVFNSVAGQHTQAKLINLPPGEYKGRYRLDRSSSTVSIDGYTLGLRVQGDTRPHVGTVLVPNEMVILPFPLDGEYFSEAKGLSFLTADNGLMIKYGEENLDLSKLKIEKGDRVLLSVEGSENEVKTLEMSINGVEGPVLRFNSELGNFKIRALAFCPNVTLFIDDPLTEPLFLIADSSITFRGIRFSSRSTGITPLRRSIMTIIGSSTVNLVNCLFDDIGHGVSVGKIPTTNTCLLVQYGATVLSTEIQGAEEGGIQPLSYSISTFGGKKGITLSGRSQIVDAHLLSVGSPIFLSQGSAIYGPSIQALNSGIEAYDDSKYQSRS